MELEESEIKRRSLEKRIRTQAVAYLRRAKTAGIPKRYMRLDRDVFKSVLYPNYHGDSLDKIVSLVYDTPLELLNIPFIVIDGGDEIARKKAAFAILFRLITCDNTGYYRGCKELAHQLSTWDKVEGIGRNDLVEELKRYDVLFVGEFDRDVLNPYGEGGCFFDEFFEDRFDNVKPTIITFSQAIQKSNPIDNKVSGRYLADLSTKEGCSPNPNENLLRIRVKV